MDQEEITREIRSYRQVKTKDNKPKCVGFRGSSAKGKFIATNAYIKQIKISNQPPNFTT